MTNVAWFWLFFGAALMFAELLAPGFVIFFFGLAAATVALVCFLCGEAFTSTWQFAAFSAFSVLYLVGLRRLLKRVFAGDRETTKTAFGRELVGRVGKVTEPIRPSVPGRVMVGDAEWNAVADEDLVAGEAVTVTDQDNLTLRVRKC